GLLTMVIEVEKPRPTAVLAPGLASICVQNQPARSVFSRREASKANCINRLYGAGDGNRTHVRSLGSFYTAIVRRPLLIPLILPTIVSWEQPLRSRKEKILRLVNQKPS